MVQFKLDIFIITGAHKQTNDAYNTRIELKKYKSNQYYIKHKPTSPENLYIFDWACYF